MSSFDIEWEQIWWMLCYTAPSFLMWCVVIFFCLIRRRENPSGAAYLGLAVLVQLISTAASYSWPYLFEIAGDFFLFGGMQYAMIGFHGITQIVFWILIIMAVFSRPVHYQYLDETLFNDFNDNDSVE